VTTVVCVGCPAAERAETEKTLASARLAVAWAEYGPAVASEVGGRGLPVLLDLSRGAAALQAARDIRAQFPSTLLFAIVDPKRPDLTTEAVLAGVADVFARPLGGRRVANAIDRELPRDARKSQVSDDLYGHSPSMREVMSLIARAATMRAGVMIRGEDGSGRQVAARAIHDSQAAGGPFIVVNCGGYENGELDRVLFGAVGAVTDVKGVEKINRDSALYQARNGSLYLQHIEDAPTRVQARLARVLRDREAVLAEGGAIVHLDLRPIAGVDLGFESTVEEGRVRDDLFKRLSVLRIEMPALRNRREDIPALANFFLRDVCAKAGVPPKTLSRPALSLLAALPWRGNADELRALLTSVVRGIQGGRNLGLEDVLAHLRLDGGSIAFKSGGTLKQARAKFERDYIAAVLEQHHGRISEAARVLGIQRTNLYRKMRALRIKSHSHGR
jgi:two-component system nitrogen regulation response regulator NtrX